VQDVPERVGSEEPARKRPLLGWRSTPGRPPSLELARLGGGEERSLEGEDVPARVEGAPAVVEREEQRRARRERERPGGVEELAGRAQVLRHPVLDTRLRRVRVRVRVRARARVRVRVRVKG